MPDTRSTAFDTREAWLNFVAGELGRTVFAGAGVAVPARVRVAVAFPSSGMRGRRIGECWDASASADGHFEIMIRPDQDDPLAAAAILAHELVHVAVGLKAAHGPVFGKLARAIGLKAPMKATKPGPSFISAAQPILERAGPLPHARLDWSGLASTKPKKQAARMLKCECLVCGYTVRIARKWLVEVGAPLCPPHGAMTSELSVSDDAEPIAPP